MNYTIVNSFG